MAFTQSTIVYQAPPEWTGSDMLLKWTATEPGLTFQVYINGTLAKTTTDTRCHLPWPTGDIQIDLGSVDADEANVDYAHTTIPFGMGGFGVLPFGLVPMLAPSPSRRADLAWQGGTFLGTSGDGDVAGFRVYGEATPGGGINYTTPLADIPAYIGGIVTDGFGLAGFGVGGFGMASGSYSWISEPLTSGTWAFGVTSYDSAGNESSADTISIPIFAPPEPPAVYPGTMIRLLYSLTGPGGTPFGSGGFGLPEAILNWNPSPT